MGINIELSLRSRELLNTYVLSGNANLVEIPALCSASALVAYLSELEHMPEMLTALAKKKQQEIEFIRVSLRTALLHDLYVAMPGNDLSSSEPVEQESWASRLKFFSLTVAGILVTACQGFDSISPMLSVLSLPSAAIMGCGFLFSLISVVVFCGFDLVKVSHSLGIKLSDAYNLLDAYLLQLSQIKAIRRKITNYNLAELSTEELLDLDKLLGMMQTRFAALAKSSQQFESALRSPNMQLAKKLVSWAAGVLFFGGGFFAGQTVALFVGGLFSSAITPVFWPVLLFGVAIGLAALGLYWHIERPGLQKLVSGWFGLNEENVTKLCDEKALEQEAKKLMLLKNKLSCMARLTGQFSQLKQCRGSTDKSDCVGNNDSLLLFPQSPPEYQDRLMPRRQDTNRPTLSSPKDYLQGASTNLH